MPSKKKTSAEISAEIANLEACKKYAPKITAFGDNNHDQIDLQIEYLRGDIDNDADDFEEQYGADALSVIAEAESWKNGERAEAPSAEWDHFKK